MCQHISFPAEKYHESVWHPKGADKGVGVNVRVIATMNQNVNNKIYGYSTGFNDIM